MGQGCVVNLLLVVPSSDWFWNGQVKIFRERAFQGGQFSCVVSTRDSALRPTPFAFVPVPLQWRINSRSPFHGSASIRTLLSVAARHFTFPFSRRHFWFAPAL